MMRAMAEYRPMRREPLIPHAATIDDDVRPECGHPMTQVCDGCTSCTACEGCYCGEAEDEPRYLLAS